MLASVTAHGNIFSFLYLIVLVRACKYTEFAKKIAGNAYNYIKFLHRFILNSFKLKRKQKKSFQVIINLQCLYDKILLL